MIGLQDEQKKKVSVQSCAGTMAATNEQKNETGNLGFGDGGSG